MSNPWAPKSAYDEVDEPVVARARRLHAALYALLFLIGMVFGYFLFEVLEGRAGLFARGVLMVCFGGVFGELGNALWLLMCRRWLRLSASEAQAAMRAPSIPSFVLARLYDRLYDKESPRP